MFEIGPEFLISVQTGYFSGFPEPCTADMQMCRKIDFQDGCHGGHLGYPIGTILAIFDLQVTPMSPTKFGVSWPFGAGEEAKYRFSRWRPWWPSGISDQNDFSYI